MPLCKCGCGNELPSGSKLKYIRGHRQAARKQDAADYVQELKKSEGIQEPIPEDTFSELGKDWESIKNPFETLRDSLPDDPEPDFAKRDSASSIIQPDGTPVVTKKVAADIQGKVAFLLSMPASMLATVDPICFPVLLEQTPEISAKLTPIICQSPDMVKFFTKGSGFILWLNLAVSVWPVIQVIIAHHITQSVGMGHDGKPVQKDNTVYQVQRP